MKQVLILLLFITSLQSHAKTPLDCADRYSALAWNHIPALQSGENMILIDYEVQHSVPQGGLTGIQGPESYATYAKTFWINFRNPNVRPSDRVHVMVINHLQAIYRGQKMALNSENYEFDLQYAEAGRFTGMLPLKEDGLLIAYQKNDGYALTRDEISQEIVVWVNGNIVKDPVSGNNFGFNMNDHIKKGK